jgi:arginine N-succinyltransferase
MTFSLRSIRNDDLESLYSLTRQFTLLNLPHDREVLKKKIEVSLLSFAGSLPREKSEYLFVVEDTERKQVIGSSLILAKHGNEDSPHHFFRVSKRNLFSRDLGIGFIHQVLQFHSDSDGPTEIGGLLIDEAYRRRPEKLGRQISLIRFIFMGMFPDRFEKRVLCELSPPLTPDGRSEFWEALGRRFTGLPYQEADLLSQKNKEFIHSLFPQEDIYLSLLDAKARIVIGQVAEETKPAQHLLKKLGFQYLEEVDPFDGGPHYGAEIKDLSLVRNGSWRKIQFNATAQFNGFSFVGWFNGSEFKGVSTPVNLDEDGLVTVPEWTQKLLSIDNGTSVFCSNM